MRADPASHGLGMTKAPARSCRARNLAALSAWLGDAAWLMAWGSSAADSLRQRIDVFLPTRDQALALGAGTVLGIVVGDQLDFLEVRHVRVDRRRLVRGQLVL